MFNYLFISFFIDFIQKYKIAILSCLGILIVGLIVIFTIYKLSGNIDIKEYKNDNYIFKYDTTWKIKEKKDDCVKLTHNIIARVKLAPIKLAPFKSASLK